MRKILVRLFVPSVNRTFDLFVPLDLEIGKLTQVIVSGVIYLCNGSYISSNEEMLNLKDPSAFLDPRLTLFNYGIKDMAELVLI